MADLSWIDNLINFIDRARKSKYSSNSLGSSGVPQEVVTNTNGKTNQEIPSQVSVPTKEATSLASSVNVPPVYVVSPGGSNGVPSALGKVAQGAQPISNEAYKSAYKTEDKLDDTNYVKGIQKAFGVKDPEYIRTIIRHADAQGIPAETMLAIAKQESNFNPKAVNSKTGASGMFQFLGSTWKDVQDRLGGAAQGVKDVFNAEQNTKAAAIYLNSMRQQLAKVKPLDKIDSKDLYLAHFSGAGRASQVIKAIETGKGSLPANKVYMPREIAANRSIFYKDNGKGKLKTIKEVYDTIGSKVTPTIDKVASLKTNNGTNKNA